MTAQELILVATALVVGLIIGAYTEGKMITKHYKKLLVDKQNQVDIWYKLANELQDRILYMVHEQKNKPVETIGSLVTEPPEISEEEYDQQQLYIQGLDKEHWDKKWDEVDHMHDHLLAPDKDIDNTKTT